MFSLGTIQDLLSSIDAIRAAIHSWVKGTRGWKRKLQLELQVNIELIFSYLECGLPVNEVVAGLHTAHMKNALESGFNFNKLKKGEVADDVAGDQPQYQQYIGWSTERLFSNIYVKIADLQTIIGMDPDNERIRPGVRLINILKLMLLLMKHLNS